MKSGVAKLLVMVVSIYGLFGCQNNPYPDGGYTDKRQARVLVTKAYSLDTPETVDFSEGVEGSFTFKGIVPAPGQAVINVDGLPKGATYSPSEQKLTWKPDFDAANDPNDPLVTTKAYRVTVTLQSTASKITQVKKTVTILVHDNPRGYVVKGISTYAPWLTEGEEYTGTFTISDDEYPNGPFTISESGAPAGVTFVPSTTTAGEYTMKYTPGFDVVTSQYLAGSRSSLDVNWNLIVVDPRGKMITTPVVWRINDSRQTPSYQGPEELTVKTAEASFVFSVQDPNLEVEPEVTVDPVSVGKVDLKLVGGSYQTPKVKGVPSKYFNLTWSGIPATEGGQTEYLSLNICVYSALHDKDNCTKQQVSVVFDFPAPTPTPPPAPTAAPTGPGTAPTSTRHFVPGTRNPSTTPSAKIHGGNS